MHVELLVEEESAASALELLLPQLLPAGSTSSVIRFQGKPDLLSKLPKRLRGYANIGSSSLRIVVLVDRDDDDCVELKRRLERICKDQGLPSKTTSPNRFFVANCLAIEELEAWFFGDVPAIVAAYPGVPPTLGAKAAFRDPDRIAGGTAEALERVLKEAGHHQSGLRKSAAAMEIAAHMDVGSNRSRSFQHFAETVRGLK